MQQVTINSFSASKNNALLNFGSNSNAATLKSAPDINNDQFVQTAAQTNAPKESFFRKLAQKSEALAAGATISKSELTRIYDDVADGIAKEYKESHNLNFQKPAFSFGHIEDNGAFYPNDNTIKINTEYLNRKNLLTSKEPGVVLVIGDDDNEGLRIREFAGNKRKVKKDADKGDLRHLTKTEHKAVIATILRHELTHAIQLQFGLSTENAQNKIFELFRSKEEYRALDDKQLVIFIEKAFPFFGEYKPNKLSKDYLLIGITAKGEPQKQYIITADMILNDQILRNNKSGVKYYSNILESHAQYSEAEFAKESLREMFPDLDEISRKKIRHCALNNASEGLEARFGNQNQN